MLIDLDVIGAVIADISADVSLNKDISKHKLSIDQYLIAIDNYLTNKNGVPDDALAFCLMQAGYWFYKFRDFNDNYQTVRN